MVLFGWWVYDAQRGGLGDRLLGLRKSFSPASQVQSGFPRGQGFREVWGRTEECSAGPLGRGQEGPTASQDFHCVLPAPAATPPPHSGPGPGELLQEQKPREGKGEEGQALAETEPERGGGGRGGGRARHAKSQRPGWEVGFTAQAPSSIRRDRRDGKSRRQPSRDRAE